MSEVDTNLQPLVEDENIDIVLNQEPLLSRHNFGERPDSSQCRV